MAMQNEIMNTEKEKTLSAKKLREDNYERARYLYESTEKLECELLMQMMQEMQDELNNTP